MLLTTIFVEDPVVSDISKWISWDVGIWHIGPNLTRVLVSAPPETKFSHEQAAAFRDAEFTKMRHRGLSVIPQFQNSAQGPDLVTR
jgi:hypothetical protein